MFMQEPQSLLSTTSNPVLPLMDDSELLHRIPIPGFDAEEIAEKAGEKDALASSDKFRRCRAAISISSEASFKNSKATHNPALKPPATKKRKQALEGVFAAHSATLNPEERLQVQLSTSSANQTPCSSPSTLVDRKQSEFNTPLSPHEGGVSKRVKVTPQNSVRKSLQNDFDVQAGPKLNTLFEHVSVHAGGKNDVKTSTQPRSPSRHFRLSRYILKI